MTPDTAERHLHAVDDDTTSRQLADLGAEQAALGAALLSATVADEISDILNPADFYQPRHGIVFAAIQRALTLGQPIDPIAITTALADSGDLNRVGGASYLHTLVASVPVAANGPWYAQTVADWAARRRLVETGIRITQLGQQTGLDVADAVNQAQALLHQATVRKELGTVTAVGDLIDPLLDELEDIARNGRTTGISTGIGALDEVIGGLMDGQFVVIAARPSMGKSVLAVDFARAAARKGHPTLIFSLEMSSGEIMRRLVAAVAEVDLSRLMRGQLDRYELDAARAARDTIASWPLFIEHTSQSDVASLRSTARRIQQQHGLDLIIVDYLQLMTSARRGNRNDRREEVDEISRGLKLLGAELECPMVVAAQLNRGPEQRADKRPQLSDLRESGGIEADADIAILLHRPDYYDRECPRAGEADFIVAKNRNGPTDTATVAAQLHFARFVDMAVM